MRGVLADIVREKFSDYARKNLALSPRRRGNFPRLGNGLASLRFGRALTRVDRQLPLVDFVAALLKGLEHCGGVGLAIAF